MAKKPYPAPIPHKDGYRLHFSYGGKQYRRFLLKSKVQAYNYQNRINQRLLDFKMGITTPPDGISLPDFIFHNIMEEPKEKDHFSPRISHLSELIEEYKKISLPPKAPRTQKTEIIHLNHLQKFLKKHDFGDPMLTSVDMRLFDYYKQYRREQGVRTDTVKKELATHQTMFQMAVDYGYLKKNVVKDVKRDKSQIPPHRFRTSEEIGQILRTGSYSKEEIVEIRRFRYLTEEEIKELIILAEGRWIQAVIITYAYTGIRRQELLNLEWADIDFTRNLLWVCSRKQSRMRQDVERCIDMHPRLQKTMKKQKEITGTHRWIFVGENGKQLKPECISENFKRLIRGTKFEGIGFHVFRHSLASNLAKKGVSERVIDKIMGHQTKEMRERYGHLFPKDREGAIEGLADYC